MKNILFVLLFVLMTNNNVFAQSQDTELIIDLNRIFPYGLPKNIKGYAVDHKGKDSLFLDMKFKMLQTYYDEVEYNLIQQIINGEDTVDYDYGLDIPTTHPGLFKGGYGGFEENDIGELAIIKYRKKIGDVEYVDTRLVLNKEGFAKWALDIEAERGIGGYVFYYAGDQITCIASPHGDNHRNMKVLFMVDYTKKSESGPNGSKLLFNEGISMFPGGVFADYTDCSYYYNKKNPIKNHSGIMINMLLDDFYYFPKMRRDLYYAGLLGLPCEYLPNASSSSVTFFDNNEDNNYNDYLGNTISISGTYTWAFSNFTKKTKSGKTKTVELPTEVVIDNTFDIVEENGDQSKLTRAEKKKLLDKFKTKNKYPQKVIFTFEW